MIVCLDTNFVIYLIERTTGWGPKAAKRFASLRAAGEQIAVCDATRLECLIKPIKDGDKVTEANYRVFFADPTILELPVTPATWDSAAQIGGAHNFKPLDSLHLATAVEHGCGLFLTADIKLARCTEVAVEVLS